MDLERELALLDARFERRQWKEARQHLTNLRENFPTHSEVLKRFKKLEDIESGMGSYTSEWISPMVADESLKLKKLKKLLSHIESRRKS
jgi:hypothetical protein